MTAAYDAFARELDRRGLQYTREGAVFTFKRDLNLSSLTSIPEGVTLSAGGFLYLDSLTSIPKGVTLSAGGSLYLYSLTSIPEGVTLSAGGYLNLSSLRSLAEGVTLSAGGDLNLYSLTSIPEGVTLSAGGYLNLYSLTSIPEGVTLSAGDSLYLYSLTSEEQSYQGQTIRLRTIDGICTRLIKSRKSGAVTLWSAQYFKGDLAADPRCFVAQEGDDYAHGDTAEKALRDLRFKVMSRDFDPDELVAEIKARGTVTLNDYRLLTGACESGTRAHLLAHGIDPDATESLPLARALEVSRDGYGGREFARLMGAA